MPTLLRKNQIASVDTDFRLQFKSLLEGVVVAFIGLACMSGSTFMGLILLILGVLMALNAFQTVLSIKTTSGNYKNVSFIIFQKAKAEQAAESILNLISGRMADTNVRQQTDRVVDAIGNIK